jgi:hypothetical protein
MTFKEQARLDLPIFFDVDEFGTRAYRNGIVSYVQRFVEPNDFGDSFYTRLVGRCADFLTLKKDDVITVDGKDYGVVSFRKDEYEQLVEIFLNG